MNLFIHGKKPFLDFSRNLSPQILFVTMALIVGNDLETSCCDYANTKQTVLFILLLLIWLASYLTNVLQFMFEFLSPQEPHKTEYSKIQNSKGLSFTNFFIEIFRYALKNNKSIYIDFAITIVIIIGSLAVVWMTSAFIATGYLEKLG